MASNDTIKPRATHLFGSSKKPEPAPAVKVETATDDEDNSILDELEREAEAAEEEEQNSSVSEVILQDGMIVTAPTLEVTSTPQPSSSRQVSFQAKDQNNSPVAPKTRMITPRRTNRNMTCGVWVLCLEEGKPVPVPVETLDHLKEKQYI